MPRPLTALVGRERELADVSALLDRDDVRLVTLTGPGGVGKTRLAVATTAAVGESYSGGSWFADLSPVRDPAMVVPTVARTMGLRDAGDASAAADWVAALIGERRVLLVLDNLEQVVEAGPALARLLAEAPSLTMLVTSRVRLRVSGEHAYPVPSLGLPDARAGAGGAESAAAVALFVERARAVVPGFRVGDQDGHAVEAICRRLDGLPLAIELAAAKMTLFTPAALLDRLERHLPVLTGGARDLPERQRTMRDAIAWSYDLLSRDERLLLPRLCVFAGGFGLGSAEAVGAVGDPVADVVTALGGLIDQSLVGRRDPVAGEPRFGVLETIREFGAERLATLGEARAAGAALVEWAVELLEQASAGLVDYPRQATWRAILDAELGNIRLAIEALIAEGRHADVLRLLGGTHEYWSPRAPHAEVLGWLETSLAADRSGTPTERCWALHLAARLAAWTGQPEAAIAYGEEIVGIGRVVGTPAILGLALLSLGLARESNHEPRASLALFSEALPHLRVAGDPMWIAAALTEMGNKLVMTGDAEQAVPLFDEALALSLQIDYEWCVALTLGERGFAALAQGHLVDAARLFEDSIRRSRAMGDDRMEQGAVAGLAGVALALGRLERAAHVLGAVEAARIASGLVRPLRASHLRPIREQARAELGEDAYERAVEAGRALSLDEVVTDVLHLVQDRGTGAPVPGAAPEPSVLTPRETDVLRLLVTGRSDREIADALFIGPRTVHTHVSNVLAKLGVGNRAEAAAVAVRRGFV